MGLLRWIVAGFGWEVGKTAAKEAIEAARKPEDPPETDAQRQAREKAARKRAERERKEREKERRRRAKEVDFELAALKKRLPSK